VQRSKSIHVLSLQIWLHAEDIAQSHLRPRETSPMQRCTLFLVSDINVNTLLVEVVQTQWLILLGGNMHHCRSVLVLDGKISSGFFNEKAQESVVAMSCSKMESCELIIGSLVDPFLD